MYNLQTNTVRGVMKKFLKVLLILVVGITISILGYVGYVQVAYPDFTYRYKMTVEVETPEGIKSGSSVIEVETSQWPKKLRGLAGGNTSSSLIRGEAVVVDLNERGVLFAPLNTKYNVSLIPKVIMNKSVHSIEPGGVPEFAKLTYTAKILEEKDYPLLVSFTNLQKPESVQKVNPLALDAIFGANVKLRSITIESTDDDIPNLVEKKLPWLNQYYGKLLDGSGARSAEATNPIANQLGAGSFKTK